MKTITRKLFISMIAVAFAFIALGTSTFAWFSMNTQVTVTGMQIGAKSDNTYLLIGNEYTTDDATTIAAIKNANENVNIAFSPIAAATVLPSKPLAASEIGADSEDATKPASGKLFASGTPVTDYASAAVPQNWYTAYNNNPKQSTDSIKEQHKLCSDDTSAADYEEDYVFANYVIKRTVYLTLATGANPANNLRVTGTIALKEGQAADKTNINGVKVLLVTDANNMVTLTSSTTTAQSLFGTSNVTLTDSNLVKVDIYIYYDGSEADVKTENMAILAAATVNLAFSVEVITQ